MYVDGKNILVKVIVIVIKYNIFGFVILLDSNIYLLKDFEGKIYVGW